MIISIFFVWFLSAVQTVVESGLAGKIHNVPEIGVEFRIKSIKGGGGSTLF